MKYNFVKVTRKKGTGNFIKIGNGLMYFSKIAFISIPKTFDIYYDKDTPAIQIVSGWNDLFKKPKIKCISIRGLDMPSGRYYKKEGDQLLWEMKRSV